MNTFRSGVWVAFLTMLGFGVAGANEGGLEQETSYKSGPDNSLPPADIEPPPNS